MPSYEIQSAINIEKLFAVKVARADETRLAFKIFPTLTQDTQKIFFEREQPRRGLQAASGLGGPASTVVLPGFSSIGYDPGYFKESIMFTDEDLLTRRLAGGWFKPATLSQLEQLATDYLFGRYQDRREFNVFQTLIFGGYQSVDAFGNIKGQRIFDIQMLVSTTPFTTLATSTPLADFRAFVVQAGFGKSVNFAGGEVWMNANTKNVILANQNPNDLKGFRLNNGDTVNSFDDKLWGFNKILLANDLPQIVVYDETWLPDLVNGVAAQPNRFIPDGYALFVGKRTDGVPFGRYIMVPQTQNGGKAGEWFLTEDKRATANPYVLVTAGHGGGTMLTYPEAVVSAKLY